MCIRDRSETDALVDADSELDTDCDSLTDALSEADSEFETDCDSETDALSEADSESVSYTHLDVYKRQALKAHCFSLELAARARNSGSLGL